MGKLEPVIDLPLALTRLKQLVKEVGSLQKENLGRTNLAFNAKSNAIDIVTEIDKKSEELIIAFIKQYYPSHSILAEESGRTAEQSDYLWIIDPLDGTTNYAQGLPIFTISIALKYKENIILGLVYAPFLDELFSAKRGQGAFLNDKRIKVAGKIRLIDSVLATGFPYDQATHPVNNYNYFCHLSAKVRAIRRFGSAAYDLASVACGRFDGFWELNLSPWDVSAGILLVEEAGGKVINFRSDRRVSIIAGNENIVGQVEEEIKKRS